MRGCAVLWLADRRNVLRIVCLAVGAAVSLTGCSRDPNVRKQKYLESGQRYFEKGEYSHAAIQFGNALQVDPRYADAHDWLAQVYLKTQDWSRAYQELGRTLDLAPENDGARLDMTRLLVDDGDFKQAREHAAILAARRPNDPQVLAVLAKFHAGQGEFALAIGQLQQAIAISPQDSELYLDLAQLQLKTNELAAAETNFKKAVTLDPKNAAAHMAFGDYYQAQRRFPDAEREIQRAIQYASTSSEPRAALVRLYMDENSPARAIEVMQQSKKDLANNSSGYRMLGDFYFAVGNFDQALAEYESLYKDHPKDLQVKKNYIQLLILKGRYADARPLNDQILKGAPGDADCLIYRGQIQTHDGQIGDAVATFERVIQNDPENAAAHYHLGNAQAQSGNLREAKSEWLDAVRIRPDLADAHRALAAAALREGDMPALARAATQIANLQPTLPDGYALLALSLLRRGQFADAEKNATKAIEVAPAHPAGYIQMGNLRMAQKRYKDSEQFFQEALTRDPASADALQSLVQVDSLENQPAKAIAMVNTQISKVPGNSAFYFLLGSLLRGKNELDGSQQAFQHAVDLNQNNLDAWVGLIQVQTANGKPDEAISTCERATQQNPRDPGLLILLGQLYDAKKESQKSTDAYQKALQIAPDNPLASNNLAYNMLENGGNPEIALSLAQVAERGMPASSSASDTLGWALYRKGAYGSAINSLRESLKLAEGSKEPDDPSVHYHLGLAYEKSGQHLLARQQLERTLKIDPSYAKADEVKKALGQIQQ